METLILHALVKSYMLSYPQYFSFYPDMWGLNEFPFL